MYVTVSYKKQVSIQGAECILNTLIAELSFEQQCEGNAEASHKKIHWTYFAISQNMSEYRKFKITKEEIQVKIIIA